METKPVISPDQTHSSPQMKRTILGIELAPFNVPLHRRLETFSVSNFYFWCISLAILGLLLPIILLFTRFYWISLLTYAWHIYDRNTPARGGRRSTWCQRSIYWKYFTNYFPARLHKTVDLDPSHNYLLGFHPHGIMSTGAYMSFSTEATGFSKLFPGIRSYLLMLRFVFLFPYCREFFMFIGICDVSKESIDWILGKAGSGNAAVVVVGGAKESLEAHPQTHRVYLSRRKGFVKKAIQHGAHLVPVYSFGEMDIFTQAPNPEGSYLRKVQMSGTKYFGWTLPMFKGRGFFNYNLGFIPYRKPINTVVGRPIPVRKSSNPSQEEIDEFHRLYMDALRQTFDENKTKYGVDENQMLEII